ncbi:unnamed protein product [Choristocarpus tenellus]
MFEHFDMVQVDQGAEDCHQRVHLTLANSCSWRKVAVWGAGDGCLQKLCDQLWRNRRNRRLLGVPSTLLGGGKDEGESPAATEAKVVESESGGPTSSPASTTPERPGQELPSPASEGRPLPQVSPIPPSPKKVPDGWVPPYLLLFAVYEPLSNEILQYLDVSVREGSPQEGPTSSYDFSKDGGSVESSSIEGVEAMKVSGLVANSGSRSRQQLRRATEEDLKLEAESRKKSRMDDHIIGALVSILDDAARDMRRHVDIMAEKATAREGRHDFDGMLKTAKQAWRTFQKSGDTVEAEFCRKQYQQLVAVRLGQNIGGAGIMLGSGGTVVKGGLTWGLWGQAAVVGR